MQGRRIGRVRITRLATASDDQDDAAVVRSGFVTLVGRPNVGKSTLLNAILGTKVTIVSDKPQTTRTQVRGVLNRPDAQVVFVDTPGIHKPRTLLGERLNDTATGAIGDVDVVCLVLDATAPVGRGDRFVADAGAARRDRRVVNKVDIASPDAGARAADGGRRARPRPSTSRCRPAPATASTRWSTRIVARLPEGPQLLPRRHGHRRARGVLGGRAGARAAARRRPRRAAALDRHAG